MSDRIDIAGWEVREVCIGLTLDLVIGPRADPGRRARIMASGLLTLTTGGARLALDVEGSRADLGALLTLHGAVVVACAVEDDSTLAVRFEDGALLEIPPDPHYEAWNLWASGGAWISELREP